MKRYKKRIFLALVTAGVLLIAVTFGRRLQHEPTLLERAQRVASTFGWSERYRNAQPGHTFYFWLNPTTMLHFRDKGNMLQGYRLKLDGSRTDTEISDLQILPSDAPLEVSPDGKLLLWLTSGADRTHIYPRVGRIDDSSVRVSPETASSPSLAGRPSNPHIRIIAREGNDHYQIIGGGGVSRPPYAIYHETIYPPFLFQEAPPSNPSLHALATTQTPGPASIPGNSEPPNVFRVEYRVQRQRGPMIEHILHVANNKNIENVTLSPDRKRLFFEERSPAKNPLPERVYQLFPALRPKPGKERCAFVVADLQTGKRKALGYYEVPYPHNNYAPQLYAQEVKWAPDGKRLSFVLEQSIFTISSE